MFVFLVTLLFALVCVGPAEGDMLLLGVGGPSAALPPGSCALVPIVVGATNVSVCTDTTATSLIVPASWNSSNNKVEIIGGGSGGLNPTGGDVAMGGCGGTYSKKSNVSLTGGATVSVTVGVGGSAGFPPTAGGNTYFNGTTLAGSTVSATGGPASSDGVACVTAAGASVGTTIHVGGSAASLNQNHQTGYGGGGAGGPGGVGGNGGQGGCSAGGGGAGGGAGNTGGAGVAGSNCVNSTSEAGGAAGDGTAGGAGGGAGTPGSAGSHGSGGGGGASSGSGAGGAGGLGQDSTWATGYGPGGGGGGGSFTGTTAGGAGGLYGGGGGTSTYGSSNSAPGGQGIIVLTWTP